MKLLGTAKLLIGYCLKLNFTELENKLSSKHNLLGFLNKLSFSFSLNTFLYGLGNQTVNAYYSIEIYFKPTYYEILMINSNKILRKLYLEPITEVEIKNCLESIKNHLTIFVEQNTKTKS